MAIITQIDYENLEDGYYVINGTKKVLCWNSPEWAKPEKDSRGQYSGYISKLAEQPKNIKSIQPVSETEYAPLYKQY